MVSLKENLHKTGMCLGYIYVANFWLLFLLFL